MNLHLEDFIQGVKIAAEEQSKTHNIFDIKGGSMFPNNESQKTWQYSRTPKAIHLSDGVNTYTFHVNIDPDQQTTLEKHPDVPLPDMYKDSVSKGKAQVHRSSPGSIYFTLQEGKDNPTYTFRHTSENRWHAIPKSRKVKKQMAEAPMIPNVNVEQVKQGAEKIFKEHFETSGGSLSFFKSASSMGDALKGIANLPSRLALAPARIGGAVTQYGDQHNNVSEEFGSSMRHAGEAGLVGAGLGGLYHYGKREFYNTPEENAQDDANGGTLKRDLLAPAGAFAGMNLIGRNMFPQNINNPDWRMFA